MDVAEALGAALAAWAQFPVHAAVRPIVPTGALLREAGYVSSEAKMAFADKRLRVRDGVDSAAVASLVAVLGPLASETDGSLVVQSAVRGRHSFTTDRGPQDLSAWSLEVTDTVGPVIVIDHEEHDRLWCPPEVSSGGGGTAVCLDDDCSALRYRFMGTPRAYADYDGVELAASETAVCVLPRVHHTVGEGQAILLYAEQREVEIHLGEPLGDRVLVTATGYPIEVLHGG